MEELGQELSEQDKASITQNVWTLVDALPQRDLIKASDARAWVAQVVELHGVQAIWHAVRLNGFGGSEIGVLVRNMHGVRADHMASAHDIVLGKLMRKIPDETNEHMTRGHENEALHAAKFYKKYGAFRDEAAFLKLTQAQGTLPWMRYSPDEVAQIPSKLLASTRGASGKRPTSRWLIDYKAPSCVEEGEEIHFQYGCQLAQGSILCEEQGVELHGLMLSQYDWAHWRLKDDVIVVSDDLKQMVRDAGNWAWGCVMRAEVPRYISTPVLADSAGFVEKNSELAVRMAHVLALSSAADERAMELRKMLLENLGGTKLDGHKIVLPGAGALTAFLKIDMEKLQADLTAEQLASVLKKDGYDEKRMAAHLKSLGVDLKQFKVDKVDPDKLAEQAESFGIDLDRYMVEQHVFKVEKPLKEEMQLFVNTHYPLAVEPSEETSVLLEQGVTEPVAEMPRG
ncbi:MAG: hypothetical protein EPN79_11270 [Burkholderiaceae bacterium]|nr:MAG: hypothetical protein EPN79_11270 [Burkholderiaceae bacterium]TBR76737.1 MAG: hypothetical protein EPN64_05805 [Burkholderiaceae bacterium]